MGNVISSAGFSTFPRLDERLGDGKSSSQAESTSLRRDTEPEDTVQLHGPIPAERPPSRRIDSQEAAGEGLARLRDALQADPARALSAHALNERQVEALLARPPT